MRTKCKNNGNIVVTYNVVYLAQLGLARSELVIYKNVTGYKLQVTLPNFENQNTSNVLQLCNSVTLSRKSCVLQNVSFFFSNISFK